MVALNKKAKGEEAKLSVGQELAFKIRSRRNRLLGLWAASRMGFDDDASLDYAKGIVAQGVVAADEELATLVAADLSVRGIEDSVAGVARELNRLDELARMELGAVDGGGPASENRADCP